MASTDLVMNLVAHDRASATFGKVAGSADHAHSRISRMATLGRMLPVAAITAFGVASVKAFADAETSQSQLEGAYKRFPKMANENIGSLRSMNSELQRKTKFDDDDLAGMQAKLAMFDLTGQQVATLTPIVADYAQVSGKDVVSAGVAVGRAMMGNTRALKSLGIEYKMTGNKAKDAANIQALLAEKTKGAAEEFGKTSAGKLAILNNQFSDLKENVGQALVPALNAMVTAITPIAKIFGDLPAPVRTGAIAVVGLAAAYNFLSPALGGVKGVIGGMARAFGLSTAATVADTAATDANTVAHRANALSGGIPGGSVGKVGKGAGIGGGAAAAGEGSLGVFGASFITSLAASLVAAVAATYVGTKVADHAGARQVGSQSGATAGGTQPKGGSTWNLSDKKLAADRINSQRILNDVIKSSVPNIDRQSQAYVKASKAAGLTDDQIKKSLATMKLTPRQIVTAFKANPEDLKTKLAASKKDLNGLKQSKVPSIRAEARTLNSQLKAARAEVNNIKQHDPTNLVARDLAKAKVQAIMNAIAMLHDKDITITTTYRSYIDAASQSHGNLDRHGRATGGAASGLAVVGERGPELVSLPEGSFVYTHSQSLAMGVDHFAKNKPLTAKQKRQKAREDKRKKAAAAAAKKIKDARNEAYKTESSSIVSFARVTGFDSSDHASALDDQQSAQREVNMAKGIGERAKALEALAAANKRVAASAPTTANVLSTFRAKLAKINAFGSVLGQLRTKLGKNAASVAGKAILNAVLEEGPENGAVIGQALLSNNGLNQALAIQGQIDTQSRWMGLASADVTSGNYIKPRPAPKKPAKKKTTKKYAHITLKIDKRVVHKSLVELKREQGGKALGLA